MKTLGVQSFRFAVVGLTSNALLYLFYLYLTWNGLTPMVAMTLAFFTGILQTFFLNKSWTFSQKRSGLHYFAKYLAVYVAAYFLNILILHIMVDKLLFPHQLVQGVAIVTIGALLFIAQRYWVFCSTPRE